jgi:hypothetical protein
MPKLNFYDYGAFNGFQLLAPESEYEDAGDMEWNVRIEEEFPEVGVVLNRHGEIVNFSVETVFGPKIIKHILAYVKSNPPPGFYTIPELGLKNVPFEKVLEAVKEYYKKHLKSV